MITLSFHAERELVWYLRDALPEFDGGSTMGPILENTALYAHRLAQEYAVSRGYSILPEGDITAQNGPRQRNESGHVPDEEVLARGADTSRILRQVAASDAYAFVTLVEHFGVHGESWQESAPKTGRIGALYWITESGQKLLDTMEAQRVASGQPDRGYHPRIRMWLEVAKEKADREQTQKTPRRWSRDFKDLRHERILRADKQAREMLRLACAVWNEAEASATLASPRRKRRPAPRLTVVQGGAAAQERERVA
jgi:hypothetical protein